jgi:hypothetical protein
MRRLARIAYWAIPILFCTALYWRGLTVWFVQDDFGWLGLRRLVTDFHSFQWAMFAPLAEGTIRPWSERGFFLLFSSLFGLHAWPYRVFIFLNQFANVILLILLTRKLTKSDLAAFLAPFFWLANPALVIPMMWTSAYNQIQCASFLLLAVFLFTRYTETGDRRYFWAQCVAFCLGFGSNELNVVYPAIAAAYAICFARKYFRSTLPLVGVSVLYTAVDRWVAGKTAGAYTMSFRPGSLFSTFEQYRWQFLSGLNSVTNFHGPHVASRILGGLLVAAVMGFIAWRLRKRDFIPLFGAAWFLITLAPFLPFHNHVTSYYVMIPAIGLAIAAGHAISMAWSNKAAVAAVAMLLAAAYWIPSCFYSYKATSWHFDRAEHARLLVQGVIEAKRQHPGKMILLDNVDPPLFWAAVYDLPFSRIFGWRDVLLTPDNRLAIQDDPSRETLDSYFFPALAAKRAVISGSAFVYSVEDHGMKDTTVEYETRLNAESAPSLAADVDVGSPYFVDQVGDGWWGIDNGVRWSGKRAVIYLPGPARPGQELEIHGWVNQRLLAKGPLHLAVTVDECAEPTRTIAVNSSDFRFDYDLPAASEGRPRVKVTVTVDRTTRIPPDERDLGLLFGEFLIK